MKKLVLLFVLVFAVGIIASPVSAKAVDAENAKVMVVVDDDTTSPEGEKEAETAKAEKTAKAAGCGGEASASKESAAGCGGEASASKESAGCGAGKSAQASTSEK